MDRITEIAQSLDRIRQDNAAKALAHPAAALAKLLAPHVHGGLPLAYEVPTETCGDEDDHVGLWTWEPGKRGSLFLNHPGHDEEADLRVVSAGGYIFAWMVCRDPFCGQPGECFIFKDMQSLAGHFALDQPY